MEGVITQVKRNQYGYYERVDMPSSENICNMFENQYYQGEVTTSYSQQYSDREIRSFTRNARKKEYIFHKYLPAETKKELLDVGCGEGYVLNYFFQKDWKVTGIDLSAYGIAAHNPQMQKFVEKGDCNVILREIIQQHKQFDVVNSDLFVDCCTDPIRSLINMKSVVRSDTGIMIVRVTNSMSPLHKKLLEQGILQKDTWFNRCGNYSYFDKNSLKNLLEELGFECLAWYGDAFMDFNLINPITDYYKVDGVGKACYYAMLDIEDIIENESLEKMVELEKVMGDMGFGRHITCVCKPRLKGI